ncbi:hypothetical protein [Allobaculum sp. Allo2]|uniref:hypothetical protein n=1 Tax=Allobaculum sp. Allo2 TaxID=2853432 RepID=UPI001F610B24|nr:hypothetical protein [Allobaculum sp. Allo2]UNT92298.1 hypothetical protein KWG61_08760 [Allobaculum sp. Allo2]
MDKSLLSKERFLRLPRQPIFRPIEAVSFVFAARGRNNFEKQLAVRKEFETGKIRKNVKVFR